MQRGIGLHTTETLWHRYSRSFYFILINHYSYSDYLAYDERPHPPYPTKVVILPVTAGPLAQNLWLLPNNHIALHFVENALVWDKHERCNKSGGENTLSVEEYGASYKQKRLQYE